MKIGMILDYTFPPDPRVENEAVALINAGHDVFLFCLNYGNQPSDEIINGIRVCRYKTNTINYKFSALAYTIPYYLYIMQKKIKHFLKTYKIEAIHIHDMRIAGAVFKANKKLKLPTVLDLHDNIPEIMKFYPHLNKFPGKYLISPKKWQVKEEEFIKKATKIVTVSQAFVDEVLDRTKIEKHKIHLVPNTVLPKFYQDAIIKKTIIERYKNNFVILYLGDTGLRRGLPTAIDAITDLKKKIPNIKLVIVGKNSTDAILKKQVFKLNLEAFVDFEGWQDVLLFPSYIVASNICISPLNRNIHHDVAYANKLFQYMSFAKPLLVSNATAQKELVKKIQAGLVHEDKNYHDFVNKVLLLYNDEDMCIEFGKNGERFVKEQFNWSVTSKSLLKLYDNLKN